MYVCMNIYDIIYNKYINVFNACINIINIYTFNKYIFVNIEIYYINIYVCVCICRCVYKHAYIFPQLNI